MIFWFTGILFFTVYSSTTSLPSARRIRTMSAPRKNILVTGGAGYIGTHTVFTLLENGYDITVVDNLINSSNEGVKRVQQLVGVDDSRVRIFNVDLCNKEELEKVFASSPQFSSCIHFAGLKAVGESVQKPILYYENNIGGTLNLVNLLEKYGCNSIVFSSSATVYGSAEVPITEETPTGHGITNAYGRTKFMIEEILKDFKVSKDLAAAKDPSVAPWHVVTLRYFNPVGSHPSGRIGEDPNGIPNNLMPFISQVAVGRREKLTIFGNDYPTPDGTGVRDYIHVMDLAEGHLAALQYVDRASSSASSYSVFNLGSGHGCSVLQVLAAMNKACGKELPYEFAPRRAGDIAVSYADTKKATAVLGWTARRSLEDMCADSWNWISSNPNGYAAKK